MSNRKYTHINTMETQIISMFTAGMTRQEIADELDLSKINKRQDNALQLSQTDAKAMCFR